MLCCDDAARNILLINKGSTIIGDIYGQGSGCLMCVEDTFVRDNPYTVIGNEFDAADFCFDTGITLINDRNNLPTLDGEVFQEGITPLYGLLRIPITILLLVALY